MDANAVNDLLARKLEAARALFHVTQQELLLVDVAEIGPLLQRKEELIGRIRALDDQLVGHGDADALEAVRPGFSEEYREVVEAALENEQAMEARLAAERGRLARELQEFEQQTRLRQYLDSPRAAGGHVNLKK